MIIQIVISVIALLALIKEELYSEKTPRLLIVTLFIATIILSIFSISDAYTSSKNEAYLLESADTMMVLNNKVDSLKKLLTLANEVNLQKDERIKELESKTRKLEEQANSIKTSYIEFTFRAKTQKTHKIDRYTLTGDPLKIKLITNSGEEYKYSTDRTFYLERVEPKVIVSKNKYNLESDSELVGKSIKVMNKIKFIRFYPEQYVNEYFYKDVYIDYVIIINNKIIGRGENIKTSISLSGNDIIEIEKLVM